MNPYPADGEPVDDLPEQSPAPPPDGAPDPAAADDDAPQEPLVLRIWSGVEVVLGVVLFALIIIGVMYQVIGRYIPSIGWVGAGELALLAMIAMTFTVTGYLVGRNGHIVIELFDQLLKGTRGFVVLRVISAVIMVVTCLALVYEAVIKVQSEWVRASAAMRVPVGVLYLFALIGFLSAAIHSAWKIPTARRPERTLEISEMEG